VRDIDFEGISAAENSNKFQKTRFWKEKSVEDLVTLWANAKGHTSNFYMALTSIVSCAKFLA
jgi:hypothetical protein